MTVSEAAKKLGLRVICGAEDREIDEVYCGDVLSIAMTRLPKSSAWVTVMGNVNSVAVAFAADAACIVLANGILPDKQTEKSAKEHNVWVLSSDNGIFDVAKAIDRILK